MNDELPDPGPGDPDLETIAAASELYQAVLAASASYRTQAETAGFSPTMAEVMAGEVHSAMLVKLMEGSPDEEMPSALRVPLGCALALIVTAIAWPLLIVGLRLVLGHWPLA